MKTGQYDVVSASGDASLRLIASGDVEPVNTDLVPNYADVFDVPEDDGDWNRVDGDVRRPARLRREPADVPHRRGRRRRPPGGAPCSTSDSPYQGKVTAYDSPIYIADAALYLMKTQPDLGIKNPYALDDKQFAAAVDLLKAQNASIGEYWSDYHKEIQAFKNGDSRDRHDLADHRQPRAGRQGAGQGDAARRGRDRLVGHLDGGHEEPSTRPAPTSGWTTSSARRRTPRSPSGSVRRRRTAKSVRPSPEDHCDELPRRGRGLLRAGLVLDARRSSSASTAGPTCSARTTATGRRPGRRSRADRS